MTIVITLQKLMFVLFVNLIISTVGISLLLLNQELIKRSQEAIQQVQAGIVSKAKQGDDDADDLRLNNDTNANLTK